MADDERQITQLGLDVGNVLDLVAGHGEGAEHGLVQIGGRHVLLVGMGELLSARTIVATRPMPSRVWSMALGISAVGYSMSAAASRRATASTSDASTCPSAAGAKAPVGVEQLGEPGEEAPCG